MSSKNLFPRHDINPDNKGDKWILQAVKAAWSESQGLGSQKGLYHNGHQFRELRSYANGDQSVTKYKNLMIPKDANGNRPDQYVQLDYTIIPFIPKFRKIALGKINSFKHNIVATAIDATARDDEDDYFSGVRAKLELIDQLRDVPGIEKMVGLEEEDPKSVEEIEIKRKFSYKHLAAIEVEQGLDLVFTNNNYEKIEDAITRDIFDFGVGGCKDYLDPNGVIRVRHLNMERMGASYCEEEDFSDARFMFEVRSLTLEDVRRESGFSKEIMDEISSLKGRDTGWADSYDLKYNQAYDDEKITVLDFEYRTIDDIVFSKGLNSRGNFESRLAEHHKRNSKNPNKKYSRKGVEMIYGCKWIVGTDYVYGAGPINDMKRKKNSLEKTSFSFHLFAPSQDKMTFYGVVKLMLPVADQIQIAWLKLQNVLLNEVPPGIAFDFTALENLNLGHAGEQWSPRKTLELYKQRGDIPYRSKNEEGEHSNGIPIQPLQTYFAQESQGLVMMINSYLNLLNGNIGFNEVTDGSTPDSRMLNGVANLAYQSTSNALSHIVVAKKRINEELCDDLVVRMQDAFSSGKVEGYRTALGAVTKEFWRSLTDISAHELSIKIEDKPSDEEKAKSAMRIEKAIDSGQITIADAEELEAVDNIKERSVLLAYRIRKNSEKKQQDQLQLIQQNGQTQQESAMVAEQQKRETLQLEYQLKGQNLVTEKTLDANIKEMELQVRLQDTGIREQGRVTAKHVENEGKRLIKAMEIANPKEKSISK